MYQLDRPNLKPSNKLVRKQEESEEYDSYGSDTDTERDPVHPGSHRSSIRKCILGSILSQKNAKYYM